MKKIVKIHLLIIFFLAIPCHLFSPSGWDSFGGAFCGSALGNIITQPRYQPQPAQTRVIVTQPAPPTYATQPSRPLKQKEQDKKTKQLEKQVQELQAKEKQARENEIAKLRTENDQLKIRLDRLEAAKKP
jgi:hypothetical protein